VWASGKEMVQFNVQQIEEEESGKKRQDNNTGKE